MMTKDEAQAWMRRWEPLTEIELEEGRRPTPQEKFEALAYLMASTDLFDFTALEAEDAAARALWARLQLLAGHE